MQNNKITLNIGGFNEYYSEHFIESFWNDEFFNNLNTSICSSYSNFLFFFAETNMQNMSRPLNKKDKEYVLNVCSSSINLAKNLYKEKDSILKIIEVIKVEQPNIDRYHAIRSDEGMYNVFKMIYVETEIHNMLRAVYAKALENLNPQEIEMMEYISGFLRNLAYMEEHQNIISTVKYVKDSFNNGLEYVTSFFGYDSTPTDIHNNLNENL